MTNVELEKTWKERVVGKSRYHIGIFLEELKNTAEILSLDSVPVEIGN
jgi:hypothetical protein